MGFEGWLGRRWPYEPDEVIRFRGTITARKTSNLRSGTSPSGSGDSDDSYESKGKRWSRGVVVGGGGG